MRARFLAEWRWLIISIPISAIVVAAWNYPIRLDELALIALALTPFTYLAIVFARITVAAFRS